MDREGVEGIGGLGAKGGLRYPLGLICRAVLCTQYATLTNKINKVDQYSSWNQLETTQSPINAPQG